VRRVRPLSLLALLVSLCGLLASAAAASAQQVLYGAGAAGDGGSPSTLYILNPSSGSALQSIGPIGFSVTGLAVDPADGTLYGSTGREPSGGAPNPGSLIKINRTTGAGTLVGDLRPDTDTAGDLTFTPDGALFGWLVGVSGNSNNLVTIDKASGAASVVGASGIVGNHGSGLASSAGGTLFHAALDTGPLYTVDRTTGAATPVAPLNGTESLQINALSFDAAGTLFGSWLDYGSTGPRPSRLLTINTASGAITFLGPSVNRLDAIVFAPKPGRSVNLKKKLKKNGTKVRLSGHVDAPGNEAACEVGQAVELQRKKPKGGKFGIFRQLKTNTAGDYSSKVKVKKTFTYRAFLPETPLCDDETSKKKKVKKKK
jgi:hypothetical protein